eukprot:3523734-Prymnesium_polylepis.1
MPHGVRAAYRMVDWSESIPRLFPRRDMIPIAPTESMPANRRSVSGSIAPSSLRSICRTTDSTSPPAVGGDSPAAPAGLISSARGLFVSAVTSTLPSCWYGRRGRQTHRWEHKSSGGSCWDV